MSELLFQAGEDIRAGEVVCVARDGTMRVATLPKISRQDQYRELFALIATQDAQLLRDVEISLENYAIIEAAALRIRRSEVLMNICLKS